MEERDLSVLSVRKLMQMLDATLLRLQKHKAESQMHKLDTKDALEGTRGVEKEKKSEIQVEAKYIAVDEDAKEAEETEVKENIEDKIDDVEEKEHAATRKQLKLQPFSSKETFGDNSKEKVKAEAFQDEDTVDIRPTYAAREAASKGMRRGWDAERVRARRREYDKQNKREKAEAIDGKEEKRDWVVNRVKQIKWGWGKSLKLNKEKEIEEKGFRVNVTQHSITGPKSFSAQSCYQRVRPVDEGSKDVVSAITTSKSLTKTKNAQGHNFVFPSRVCKRQPEENRDLCKFSTFQLLKKSVQSSTVIPTIPPALLEQLELQVQPETVCKVRKLMNGQLEVLIQQKDMSSGENSWEDAETIATQFPGFHLEDKVKLLGEGNERTLHQQPDIG